MSPSPARSGPAPRFRSRRLELPNGELLVLGDDGAIEHRDVAGAVTERWTPEDAAWGDHAIRFGLHPSATTVAPRGRYVPGEKPPL